MKKKTSVAIVGAGLYGATVASILSDEDFSVTVFEARDVVGGNVHSYYDPEVGCHINTYGAHIFHTNSERVWEFVNNFSKFNGYVHYVKGKTQDAMVSLPFGMELFSQLLGVFTPEQAKSYLDKVKAEGSGLDTSNVEGWCLANIGSVLYHEVVKNYTEKQWGVACSALPSEIIKRLPIRWTYDRSYFNARWQGMPVEGYTSIVQTMLHLCEVHTGKALNLQDVRNLSTRYDHVVFSGQLDALYGYDEGELPYRGLRFEDTKYPVEYALGAPVVNDLTKNPYTREIEHKMFYPETRSGATLVTREFPDAWDRTKTAFYPVRTTEAVALHKRYLDRAQSEMPNLTVGGRLGSYLYYDMDQIVAMGMKDAETILKGKR